ncbi:MAG: M23 family metallopeptidase [Anaerolineales bacterium]|nr:M23 family metallopeptidase [Anaerolineales bacterium]
MGHNGIDFLTPTGTLLYAVDGGEVAKAGYEAGGFGNYVLLRHPWGESIYGHLDSVGVTEGQAVGRGQYLGKSGATGGATGPHLHFALRVNPYVRGDGWGGFTDPLPYLPPDSFVLPGYVLDPPAAPAIAPAFAAPKEMSVTRDQPSSMGDTAGEERP